MQSEINIKVGNKSPKEYFVLLKSLIENSDSSLTGIHSWQELEENLKIHCIPCNIVNMDIDDYSDFLLERRRLMALKIKEYYFSL